MSFQHIMLDLETFGSSSNSIIASIAAVPFNIETGETGTEFYYKINIQSCVDAGLHFDASTVLWWLSQPKEAQEDLLLGVTYLLRYVLMALSSYIEQFPDNTQIGGNSNRFDCGLIDNAYQACKLPLPWKYWNERDVRTLVSFAPEIKRSTPFTGIKHNPVDDCKHQIAYCSAIWQHLHK